MAGLQLSGLGSGFDWKSIVDQLMTIEQTPITRMQTEQSKNNDKSVALSSLDTILGKLQTSSTALNNSGLFNKRTAISSVSGSTWSATAADGTVSSSYKIAVTELATAAVWNGGSDIGKKLDSTGTYPTASVSTLMSSLPTGVPVTAGTFTVNGNTVNVALSDSLDTVLANIGIATGGTVTATYNDNTDKIEFRSSPPGTPIVLGSGNDSSNFLQAIRVSNNGTDSIDSASNLGTTVSSTTLQNARLGTELTDPNLDGSGTFTINGVSITFNSRTDSLNTVLAKISSSTAGVSATYDSVNDRVVLTNKNTGNVGFSVKDVTGNLMAALKISNATGTLQAGKNALFSINDGGTLTSMSNTLDASAHGIAGLSVTVNSKTTENVTVASNTADAKTAINNFISDFNSVQSFIGAQTKITRTGNKVTTSPLSDNHEVQSWSDTLRSMAFGTISGLSGSIKRMEDLGIGFTGTSDMLSIKSSTKLDAALSSAPGDVADFFTNSTSGFAKSIGAFFIKTIGDPSLETKGTLDAQIANLSKYNANIDKQIAEIQRQLVEKRSRLETAFIAMDTAQSQSSRLMTQISKIGATSS